MTAKPQTQKAQPLLPTQNLAGPALAAVAAVMSFLACLALGSVLLISAGTQQWVSRAGAAMSVQIIETRTQTAQEQLPAVLREIAATKGIASARTLEQHELVRLLEPWLGTGNITADLPIPLLIEITPHFDNPLNTKALAARLKSVAPGAHLDTHGQWRENLAQWARAINLFGAGVVLVVGIATAMLVLFATRAGLIANRPILDVLHQIGAHDRFIARIMQAHFTRLTGIAASLGAMAACLFFYLLGAELTFIFFLTLALVPLTTIILATGLTLFYVLRNLRHYN
ncbi:MAG: ABC transporter permease [Alphaproteobacteria bacterium]|nr:ABC transporter permease [Alphaproteobacteria bacterium]